MNGDVGNDRFRLSTVRDVSMSQTWSVRRTYVLSDCRTLLCVLIRAKLTRIEAAAGATARRRSMLLARMLARLVISGCSGWLHCATGLRGHRRLTAPSAASVQASNKSLERTREG